MLINDDIGPADNISWVATVWTLGTTVGFLLVCRLSDIFDGPWLCCNWIVDNITFPGVTVVIEPQDVALASGVLGSIRGTGGAVEQALYTSILNNKIDGYIPAYVGPTAVKAGLPESELPMLFNNIAAENFTAMPDVTLIIELVVDREIVRAYISSFLMVFFAGVPFAVLLILPACFVPNMEGLLGGNVAKRLQGLPRKKEARKEELKGDDRDKGVVVNSEFGVRFPQDDGGSGSGKSDEGNRGSEVQLQGQDTERNISI
ncbi:uncharacterized protein PAC_17302 [Phialocephala subalpina]|uniref:Uncharacterized protein n=1 Tax=Phialocephala subalpina TaxID=576137 RepID=A0A1L7XQT1_9HELO|nr:uncharacterized protein PAC_17302 [Phialocephala subalpina]